MQEIVQKYYVETLPGLTILDLELACEDQGQAVVYRGTIPYYRHALQLDKHHWIETGKQFPGCGMGIPFIDTTTGEQKSGCC